MEDFKGLLNLLFVKEHSMRYKQIQTNILFAYLFAIVEAGSFRRELLKSLALSAPMIMSNYT